MKFGLQPESLGGNLFTFPIDKDQGSVRNETKPLQKSQQHLNTNLKVDKIGKNQLENLFTQQMIKVVNSLNNDLVKNKKDIIYKIKEYGFSFPQYAQCEEDPFLMSLVPLCTFVIDQMYVE